MEILFFITFFNESLSFTEPLGWIIALTPFLAASSTTSLNGKNASEESTTSVALNLSFALSNAFSAAQILLTSPPPIPSVCKFLLQQ